MTPTDSNGEKQVADATPSAARGEKAFAVFDYAIKVAKVSVVVLGIMLVAIALSGVDMARMDEHEVFRYRMYAVPALIVGYLLIDYVLAGRRATRAAEARAHNAQRKRGYAVELMALAFVAAGGAAFWHDHMSHEIPNPVAVPAKFVSAKCVDQSSRRIGGSVGPHMSLGYEFPSLSTSVRAPEMKCLLANCELEKSPPQYMDAEYKKVFYASLAECQAALPAVLAAKAPVTVWTGDKDPNASVRARFTPEREKPPYFLLWFPSAVAACVLLISGFRRLRSAR